MYYSAYEEAALRPLAQALAEAAGSRAPAWCIFDNTAHGHAMADAARLQALLAGKVEKVEKGSGSFIP